MSRSKTIALSLVSAFLGGSLVVALIFLNPMILPSTLKAEIQDKENLNEKSRESSEENLLKYMDKYHREMMSQFDSFFDDRFFNQRDSFESMREFRNKLKSPHGIFSDSSFPTPFDSWFGQRFGGGSVDDIQQREDENFVYFDVRVDDLDSGSIDTQVENGVLTIRGQKVSKKSTSSEEGHSFGQSVFSSSFSRSIPLPHSVDHQNMEIDSEGDKMVIKFPKLKI